MLKLQSINNFRGFGGGDKLGLGEYYYAHNLRRSYAGILPGWNTVSSITNATLSGLGNILWYAQAAPGSVSATVYGIDDAGFIYSSLGGSGTWGLLYKPGESGQGNGLIGGQDNNLYYLMERYLGKYDGTANYTTGTSSVTNGSAAVVGTGTVFTAGMVGKRIRFGSDTTFYTIATRTNDTNITITPVYGGSTNASQTHNVYSGWTDQFKDFGSGSLAASNDYRPACSFEDWIVMGNGRKVAILNVTDNSFNASAFTLPAGFKVRDIRPGRNGVLIGANFGNRSVAILWDVFSTRSVAPWIWFNATIQSICPDNSGNWILATNRRIYLTNGYTAEEYAPFPDATIDSSYLTIKPQGMEVVGDRLTILNTTQSLNRIRSGIYILDPATKLWEYVAPPSCLGNQASMGAIFFDSNFRTHLSWRTGLPNVNSIGFLSTGVPDCALYISPLMGIGNNNKTAEALKMNMGLSTVETSSSPITFTISVKVANAHRNLWNYAQQKVLATEYDKVTVDGTLSGMNNAEVGDEVTILEGVNAGEVRHISSISGKNTTTEVWTLDSVLPGYTEQNANIQVMPFKLARKNTITNATELKDIYFDFKNKLRGKKFYIKITFDNLSTVVPEIFNADFIYDDLGAI